jgi:hypothetical protein
MTGTYAALEPLNIGGVWYQPPKLLVQASIGADGRWYEPWRGANPPGGAGAAAWTPGDTLPISLPTAALTVLVNSAGATMIG